MKFVDELTEDELIACMTIDHSEPITERCVMGITWGEDIDPTVVVVMGLESKQTHAYAAFHTDTYGYARTMVKTLAHQWKPASILAKANGLGTAQNEALHSEGLDAPHDVVLGENTLDEMCLGAFGIATPR